MIQRKREGKDYPGWDRAGEAGGCAPRRSMGINKDCEAFRTCAEHRSDVTPVLALENESVLRLLMLALSHGRAV